MLLQVQGEQAPQALHLGKVLVLMQHQMRDAFPLMATLLELQLRLTVARLCPLVVEAVWVTAYCTATMLITLPWHPVLMCTVTSPRTAQHQQVVSIHMLATVKTTMESVPVHRQPVQSPLDASLNSHTYLPANLSHSLQLQVKGSIPCPLARVPDFHRKEEITQLYPPPAIARGHNQTAHALQRLVFETLTS